MPRRSVERSMRWWLGVIALGCGLSPASTTAQRAPSGFLTLNDAIQLALQNYPAIKESDARAGRRGRRWRGSNRVPATARHGVAGAIVRGARVAFTVPAYPGETFCGVVSLIAHDLDEKTRSMAVELDVRNPDLRLSAGMYPEVQWPVRRPRPSLLIPPTSIVTTTERTFVVRVTKGVAEWVNVTRGARVGDLVEVFGALKDGDSIVRRGTDELREGTKISAQLPKGGE